MDRQVTVADYNGPKEWVSLHSHTLFSSLDGVASPEQYAETCKSRGYPAFGITEHGNLASVPDAYQAFKKAGVQYIPGIEAYFSDYHAEYLVRHQAGFTAQLANKSEDPVVWEDFMRLMRSRHLTILAKNQVGFTNLIKLSTEAHRRGHHHQRGRSRISFDMLAEFREGLVVLSGCLNSSLAYALRQQKPVRLPVDGNGRFKVSETGPLYPKRYRFQNAINEIKRFKALFKEDYYIELQMPVVPERVITGEFASDDNLIDAAVFRYSVELADAARIPVVLTNDVHYLTREDAGLQKLMMAIDQGVEIDSPDLFYSNSSEQYFKERAELWCTFRNGPYSNGIDERVFHAACDNSVVVAERCKPLKLSDTPKIPKWNSVNGVEVDPDAALRDMVYQALKDRGLWDCQDKYNVDGQLVTYQQQAILELERFISKGFSSYFLITSDLVQHGRSRGYPFSPRGSASGSLVCMVLGIHNIDPLKWGLSFDRFMSPSRGGYLLKVTMGESIN